MTPQDDGAHLLETLPPTVAREVAEVARMIPCTPGQAVAAWLLLVDRVMGDRLHVVDPDGRRIDVPLDPRDCVHLFVDLPQDAMTRLLTLLASRLHPTLLRIQRTLERRATP
jgi:hypothetical protein